MSRFARHRDKGEPAIVAAFLAMGATVLKLNGPAGSPDLCVGFKSQQGPVNLLVEVKSELKTGRKDGYVRDTVGELSEKQQQWHQAWRGQVAVVRTPDEAVELVMSYFPVRAA